MLSIVINVKIMKRYTMYTVYSLLMLVLLFMLTLNEWSEILIQKYEKSLALVLVLRSRVLVLVFVLTKMCNLHHWIRHSCIFIVILFCFGGNIITILIDRLNLKINCRVARKKIKHKVLLIHNFIKYSHFQTFAKVAIKLSLNIPPHVPTLPCQF